MSSLLCYSKSEKSGSLSTVVSDEKLMLFSTVCQVYQGFKKKKREDSSYSGSLSTVVGDEKRLFVNCSG